MRALNSIRIPTKTRRVRMVASPRGSTKLRTADMSVAATSSAPKRPTTICTAITPSPPGKVSIGRRGGAWQDRAMREAVVAAMWRHPVKSMQGESPEHAVLERDGLAGDRVLAVIDRPTGLVLNAMREGRLLQTLTLPPPGDPTGTPLV